MKKYLTTLLAACCMLAAFSMPASALEYHFDGPDAGLFGRPTSDDTIYVTMDKPANTDRSKNAAYIPPAFGSPTSYTLNAGELLTPNLVSGSATGTVSGTGGVTVLPPSASSSTAGGNTGSYTPVKYTAVAKDLYYSGGYLGTLKIPTLGLSVKVYQGTDADALRKGAGHFASTSIWCAAQTAPLAARHGATAVQLCPGAATPPQNMAVRTPTPPDIHAAAPEKVCGTRTLYRS